ncbi:MAG: histidinol-phosphate transaminase [Eubacteriales bacterium]|nr:histidinol-phosphate transaminase [Eubacteriales bacterium]
MSRFLSSRFSDLEAYTPGEQFQNMKFVKLNTNESPYPPSPGVLKLLAGGEAEKLNLYPDPEGKFLRDKLAALYGVNPENVILGNGSDELLGFAFLAFGPDGGVLFPDVSYGFYPVYARVFGVDAKAAPLCEDFSIDPADYMNAGRMVVIANPNAPTGLTLSLADIEKIVVSNPDHVVLIDEAYVDFGAESAVALTKKYENLLVVHTYSKARSMAGARLGYAIGSAELIADLNRIRYSFNPYNINRLTLAAGACAIDENDYYRDNCRRVAETREQTKKSLRELGFTVTDSKANFLLAKPPVMDGEAYYLELKRRGVLVRHFSTPRVKDWVRITVGSPEQMETLLRETRDILA